ncbi:Rossmann-fold NAD(P)-binding domain-containing protein [Neolewinella xylanilytica]|uniref:hypothetical protein n=1 Tax=Neolewinella xylanilytica TaxID=1514080 RepID=UPI0011B04517|nr:hypothetical protein [Neolewinella xylanilytica]
MAILGTGWLGLPLAAAWAEENRVHGSFRSEATRDRLVACGAVPFKLDLPGDAKGLPAFLEEVTTLVVALPPGGRKHGAATTERYLDTLAPLQPFLSGVHLIYTSSTGVYGKSATGLVTENTSVAPDTHSSRAVVAAENFFVRYSGKCTLLRLAGLYGPDRDPVRFYRNAEAIPDGDAPVNMVPLEGVLQAIDLVAKSGTTGIFNVCSARHPSKRTFYGSLYAAAELPAKEFFPGGADGKRIESSKLRQLGWQSP